MFGWHHHRERRIRKGQRGTELEREREGGGGGLEEGRERGRRRRETAGRDSEEEGGEGGGGGLETADAADVGNKFLVVRVCGC